MASPAPACKSPCQPLVPANETLVSPPREAIEPPSTIPAGEPPLVSTQVEEVALVATLVMLWRRPVKVSTLVRKDEPAHVVRRVSGALTRSDGHSLPFGTHVTDAITFAVSKYRFEPYVADGQTVEVGRTMACIFVDQPSKGLIGSSGTPSKDDADPLSPTSRR